MTSVSGTPDGWQSSKSRILNTWFWRNKKTSKKISVFLLNKVVCHFLWCVGCLAVYKSYDVPENQGGGKFDTLLSLWFAYTELTDAMGCCLWADCTSEDVYFNLIWCFNSWIYNQIYKYKILVIHSMCIYHTYSTIYI